MDMWVWGLYRRLTKKQGRLWCLRIVPASRTNYIPGFLCVPALLSVRSGCKWKAVSSCDVAKIWWLLLGMCLLSCFIVSPWQRIGETHNRVRVESPHKPFLMLLCDESPNIVYSIQVMWFKHKVSSQTTCPGYWTSAGQDAKVQNGDI